MKSCTYCGAGAIYHDRQTGAYLCLAHARLEVTGPRGKAPRPPLTIRPATPADRSRISELAHYFWGEVEVECFGHSYRVDALPAYLACDVDEIVGLASYAREGDAVNLVMLNVLLRWQGRGVGRELVAAVNELARAEGAKRVIVATSNDDLLALGFYQQLGFTITEVLVGKLVEHHGAIEAGLAGIPVRDEIHLELRLKP
ncbi:MAG TPA: GNAT family N-acetyltransferase [Anaerolineae bacterium]|nr:GNAT family N-acetyltransferase [Anaerolineae bacterium]